MMHPSFASWPNNCPLEEVKPPSCDRMPNVYLPGHPMGGWSHEVPQLMPWGGQPSPFLNPDPCTSRAATSWEQLHNPSLPMASPSSQPPPRLKRKVNSYPELPQKLCITEEHMAARFKDMHITNQFILPEESSVTVTLPTSDPLPVTNLRQFEEIMGNDGDDAGKSIILAPEVKKLIEPEKIFARTFSNKVERPSMAVMLWQPQGNPLVKKSNVSNENSEVNEFEEKLRAIYQGIPAVGDSNVPEDDSMDT